MFLQLLIYLITAVNTYRQYLTPLRPTSQSGN